MTLASLLFALTMLFAKLLSSHMGSVEVTFFRNIIGLFLILMTLWHTPLSNKGGRPWTLFFRGLIGTLALLSFFYTVSVTHLSHAIVYAKTEPIFTAILAFFLLKEKLSPYTLIASLLGLLGVAILSDFHLDYLDMMGIMTGFMAALAYTSVRSLKPYYDARTVVLSFMLCGTLLPVGLMIVAQIYTHPSLAFALQPFVLPTPIDWIWILAMGSVAAYGQLAMTKSYYYAKAGLASTASYSVVLFATLLGLLVGDTAPSLSMMIGAFLIIGGGILIAKEKA